MFQAELVNNRPHFLELARDSEVARNTVTFLSTFERFLGILASMLPPLPDATNTPGQVGQMYTTATNEPLMLTFDFEGGSASASHPASGTASVNGTSGGNTSSGHQPGIYSVANSSRLHSQSSTPLSADGSLNLGQGGAVSPPSATHPTGTDQVFVDPFAPRYYLGGNLGGPMVHLLNPQSGATLIPPGGHRLGDLSAPDGSIGVSLGDVEMCIGDFGYSIDQPYASSQPLSFIELGGHLPEGYDDGLGIGLGADYGTSDAGGMSHGPPYLNGVDELPSGNSDTNSAPTPTATHLNVTMDNIVTKPGKGTAKTPSAVPSHGWKVPGTKPS